MINRRILYFSVAALIVIVSGCEWSASGTSSSSAKAMTINSDIPRLRKLIQLPDSVTSVAWQVREQSASSDWWLAAYLEFSPQSVPGMLLTPIKKQSIALPVGLSFAPPFDKLRSLVGADNHSPYDSFVADTVPVQPFAKSPLLNGMAVPIDDTSLFVFLYTR